MSMKFSIFDFRKSTSRQLNLVLLILMPALLTSCASQKIRAFPADDQNISYALLLPTSVPNPQGFGPGITSVNGEQCNPSIKRDMCPIAILVNHGNVRLSGRFETARSFTGASIAWREIPFSWTGTVEAGYVYAYGARLTSEGSQLVVQKICKSGELREVAAKWHLRRAAFKDRELSLSHSPYIDADCELLEAESK